MNKSLFFGLVIIIVGLILGGSYYFMNMNNKDNSIAKPIENKIGPTVSKQQAQNYSLSDIAKHSTQTDCWMAINGKVYDVTGFVNGHPGGKAIINGCGKDATKLFNERPSNQQGPHPSQAMDLLPKFEIGELSS